MKRNSSGISRRDFIKQTASAAATAAAGFGLPGSPLAFAQDRSRYNIDKVITSITRSWLRGKARELGGENKPWFMAVNLVNPHGAVYYIRTCRADPLSRPQRR